MDDGEKRDKVDSKPVPAYESNRTIKSQTNHLIAGCMAGAITAMILHPLDLLKTRFQVQDSASTFSYKTPKAAGLVKEPVVGANPARPVYRGFFNAYRTILKSEGVLGLYQGFTPNAIGSGVSWGLYFGLYDTLKKLQREQYQSSELSSADYMGAAFMSGAMTTLVTNPIWVVKTRMQLVIRGSVKETSVFAVIRGITRDEGLGGFYKGLSPALVLCLHGAIQFTIYENLKTFSKRHNYDKINKVGEYAFLGAISKGLATLCTYPFQVARTRLQQREAEVRYKSFLEVFTKIVKYEGVVGFYKGFLPSVLRMMPASALTLSAYETVSSLLNSDLDR